MNPAPKSVDAWVRIASSVQSRPLAQLLFNAPPARTARWKRRVPRFAPINVLIANWFYLHALQLTMPVKPTPDLFLKALLLIFACSFICQAQAPQARTRRQFAALVSRVSPEIFREEVEAILGKPDDIITKYDAAGIRSVETGETWRYGANGHLTTATLGNEAWSL
jgi:hypothetical protein